MLVKSLDDIKSTELITCRFACCGTNELVVLCDPSDRTNYKIKCPECERVHEIDMKPVFMVGLGDNDWNAKEHNKPPLKDVDIKEEISKIDSKFKVF